MTWSCWETAVFTECFTVVSDDNEDRLLVEAKGLVLLEEFTEEEVLQPHAVQVAIPLVTVVEGHAPVTAAGGTVVVVRRGREVHRQERLRSNAQEPREAGRKENLVFVAEVVRLFEPAGVERLDRVEVSNAEVRQNALTVLERLRVRHEVGRGVPELRHQMTETGTPDNAGLAELPCPPGIERRVGSAQRRDDRVVRMGHDWIRATYEQTLSSELGQERRCLQAGVVRRRRVGTGGFEEDHDDVPPIGAIGRHETTVRGWNAFGRGLQGPLRRFPGVELNGRHTVHRLEAEAEERGAHERRCQQAGTPHDPPCGSTLNDPQPRAEDARGEGGPERHPSRDGGEEQSHPGVHTAPDHGRRAGGIRGPVQEVCPVQRRSCDSLVLIEDGHP